METDSLRAGVIHPASAGLVRQEQAGCVMGVELAKVVDYVRKKSRGAAVVDLARLNLLVGRAISRNAMSLPDEPEFVARAWYHARAILGEPQHEGAR